MKKAFFHIILLALCWACTDTIEPSSVSVKIGVDQQQSSFLFAGLPVFFGVMTQQPLPSPVSEWSFGDQQTSKSANPYHTFDFPGTYRVSAIVGNSATKADSTIAISPSLHLIGSKLTTENGKFIFERPGGYTLIHTLNMNSSADTWRILSTSETFDSLASRPLTIDTYDLVYEAIMNKNGNIVAISDDRMMEIAQNRAILKTVYSFGGWTPIKLIETSDGYLVSGWGFDGLVNVASFDYNLEQKSITKLNIQRAGFGISDYYLERDGTIRIQYYTSDIAENLSRVIVKADLNGTVLFEKTYPSGTSAGQSVRLGSGYIMYGGGSAQDIRFTRIDQNGNVVWTVSSPRQSEYPQLVHSGRIAFIEDGSSVVIFFDNQKGMKVSSTGEVIWLKRFGLFSDTFDTAIRNKKGNIILLGSHQFDYIKNEFTNEYSKRDLVLMEIDLNGNIVGQP